MLDILDNKFRISIMNCVDWVILTRLIEFAECGETPAVVTPFRNRLYTVRLLVNLASI
jgi:hypothetical protein